MGEVPEIKDLHKIIEPHLQGATLESYQSQYLTKPGDNYGSIMLAITAKIRQPTGSEHDLPLVAKLPPLTNDLYWQIFQPERTCVTENAVYKFLAPELEKLQLEAGVLPIKIFDGFPRYYGSRISLRTDATKVDRNAVLVQENLTARKYCSGNRHKPYDLAHTVLLLHYMAKYHALPIALRLRKPKTFQQNILPYFKKFNINDTMSTETRLMLNEETLTDIKAISKDNDQDVKRVQELLDIFDAFQSADEVQESPWTSIVHMDLWINNLMVKYDDAGVPQKLKFVDFQIAQYESLVHDVIFLLLSSVDSFVLEDNYYNFLRIYYEAFIRALSAVNINTSEYNYQAFLDEVQRVAHIQVPHALFMTKVVLAENSSLPTDYKDVDLTVITKNRGVEKILIKMSDILRHMDNLPVIHKLGRVINPFLNDGKLHSYDVRNLTQLGDNYGSILISIRAQVKRPNGELFVMRLVAKVPPTDPKYWQFIQPERTCLAENAIYRRLAPALRTLQENAGIPRDKQFEGFAKYFGSRTSLKPMSNIVDMDAILVLEDLRDSNYVSGQRILPFDLLHTHLALQHMAQFHALTIGLRIQQPQIFETEIRPYFNKFDWHAAAPESKATMIDETLSDIREATNDEKMVALFIKLSNEFFKFLTEPADKNNVFNCIIHSDFWTMNLMFKYDASDQPTQLKMIDFQTAQFDSIVHDLISFLLTSISTSILEVNYHNLLRFYYDAFISSLCSVDANSSAYSYEAFRAEVKRVAHIQVPHAIFMTRFILADNATPAEKKPELSEVLKRRSSKRVIHKLSEILRLAHKLQIL